MSLWWVSLVCWSCLRGNVPVIGGAGDFPFLVYRFVIVNRAVALETVSMQAEPFSLSSEGNFSPADPRTRITLFCMNLDFLAGEPGSALTADAQDAAGTSIR